jgi:two-component system, OmpR family, sensor histidine kinase BaeS
MRRRFARGIGSRIALAALFVSVLAVGIVAVGTLVVGGRSFVDLMTADGHSSASAQSMFDTSVGQVVAMALVGAIIAAVILSAVLATRIARPLRDMDRAAGQIARGDYGARVSPKGPEELAGLAESFNSMAASLEEQERLRRELIANAAHELRTPLTNLQGYLEALRDEVIPADRATFESLWDEAERLVRLSRSLDVLAEGDSVGAARPLATVDVSGAVRAAADLVAPAMVQAVLKFETEIEPTLAAIAEPDGLAQVLGNLLQNAVRYTPSGGTVRLRAERQSGAILVSVTNTGPDIPASDLPHLFERFYRVEKSRSATRGGAGIGLAIVRQLVQSFGGQVGVESRGGLTRFWFSLRAIVAVTLSPGTADGAVSPIGRTGAAPRQR